MPAACPPPINPPRVSSTRAGFTCSIPGSLPSAPDDRKLMAIGARPRRTKPASRRLRGNRKLDPDRRVVARFFPAADIAIDIGCDEPLRNQRIEQEMVEAKPGIAAPGIPEIVPEGVDA